MRPPNVLVGIPTYKRPAQLWACLQSIACQKAEGLNVRVFVADNDPDALDLALTDCAALRSSGRKPPAWNAAPST